MTVTGKAILLGIALFVGVFKKKPTAATPAAPEETPKPTPEPEPQCATAVLGKRWTICDGNIATISEGQYDALYNDKTNQLMAVIDNTTYDDNGDSGFVVGVLDPAGYIKVLSSRDDVPFFPVEYGSDVWG